MWDRIQNWLQIFRSKSTEIVHEDHAMKYLIAGLGNIGSDYENTRHNIGFDVVDQMAKSANVNFKSENLADIAEIKHKGRFITLIKPSTFMNRSGKSIKYWMQKLGIPKENVLVILDDLNLEFGKIRMRAQGTNGGHNGLKDIELMLGGPDYSRLRVGIGDSFNKGQQIDFVLGKWNRDELKYLPEIIDKCGEAALSFCAIGLKFTMEKFNGQAIRKEN